MPGLSAIPNPLAFAASYVAALILLGVVLMFRVARFRHTEKIGIGDGGNREMMKRIRAHGNFSENAPFLVAILILLPMLGAREWLIHAIGVSAVAGRILHAIGLSRTSGYSFGRGTGMTLTLLALVLGALSLIVLAWK